MMIINSSREAFVENMKAYIAAHGRVTGGYYYADGSLVPVHANLATGEKRLGTDQFSYWGDVKADIAVLAGIYREALKDAGCKYYAVEDIGEYYYETDIAEDQGMW